MGFHIKPFPRDVLFKFCRILDGIYKEFLNFYPFLYVLSYKLFSYKACNGKPWHFLLSNSKYSMSRVVYRLLKKADALPNELA